MARKKIKALIKSTKKEAIAQAVTRPGKGIVRINSRNLDIVDPIEVRTYIQEPMILAPHALNDVDVHIHVQGGGAMSQAVAVRACLAKTIVEHTRDEKIRKEMIAYDRMLLVDDPRRVEPKKPLGPKARRKKQHSKR